jgi:hypothetical protein
MTPVGCRYEHRSPERHSRVPLESSKLREPHFSSVTPLFKLDSRYSILSLHVWRGIELRDTWVSEYIIGGVRVAAGNGLENLGRHCCEFAVLAELPPLLHVYLSQLLS